jgi:hypothetical protein
MRIAVSITFFTLALMISACSDKSGGGEGPVQNEEVGVSEDAPGSENEKEEVKTQSVKINVGAGVLTSPTDFQMAVAFFNVVGLEPPFDQWAGQDRRVRAANEFDRAGMIARVQEELTLAASAVTDVGYVVLNASSDFGEYDMNAQGFRLEALDSSRFYTWNYLGNQYKLTMENGNEAQLWKIAPEEAKALVQGGNYRNVNLAIKFKIVGALPEGQNGTLKAKIASYDVLDRGDGGRKLGSMAFEE